MSDGRSIISLVAQRQDLEQFRKKNWEGSFEHYLDVVRSDPKVTRNAFERVFDMVMSYGTDHYEQAREKRIVERTIGKGDWRPTDFFHVVGVHTSAQSFRD